MNLLQFDLLSFAVFLLLFWFCFYGLAKLLKLEKRGWEIGPGYFMARTTRLNRLINKIAKRFPRFWRVLWTIGIGFGFGAMIFGLIFLGFNLYALITAPQPENALVPFIPGVTVTGSVLLYMILPIAIIMLAHEIAHGIACRIGGVKVKSSGVLALIILFGAFVEPDDEQLATKSRVARQRIYAAGSFANLIVAFFAMLLLVNMYSVGNGAQLVRVVENSPSSGNLSANELILEVNGTQITYDNLSINLDPFKPYDPVLFTVKTENGSIQNRTVIAGFDRSKINYTSWELIQIHNGSLSNGSLISLSNYDLDILTLQSANGYLNFSLFINLTNENILPPKIIAFVIDLAIKANVTNFNSSQISLKSYQNITQNYQFFSSLDLFSGFNGSSAITQIAGYNLSHFINSYNSSNYITLNFAFNNSIDFLIWMDLCRIYVIENDTDSYFGIVYKVNLIDRELAIILGPLAPHVYQMLLYLYIFSFAVGIINLLPIPPFDGDALFVSLFKSPKPVNTSNSENKEKTEDSNSEEPKLKEPWTWKNTVIWSVRILAIFLFLSNIILSIINFNIFTLFSTIF